MRPKNYSIPRTRGKKVELACDCGCGTVFYRYWNKVSAGENFLNREHAGIARRKRYLQDHCGVFLPLFEEYLAEVVGRRYRDARSPINHVAPFLKYLGEICIDSIADVEPSHVTSFQIWGRERGYIAASKDASTLSTFFKWAVVTDHYKEENPVTPAVHGRRKTRGSGRPYSFDEMEVIRRSLQGYIRARNVIARRTTQNTATRQMTI